VAGEGGVYVFVCREHCACNSTLAATAFLCLAMPACSRLSSCSRTVAVPGVQAVSCGRRTLRVRLRMMLSGCKLCIAKANSEEGRMAAWRRSMVRLLGVAASPERRAWNAAWCAIILNRRLPCPPLLRTCHSAAVATPCSTIIA
jgi:hypothetical protein